MSTQNAIARRLDVQFIVIATATVAPDGTVSLELDWSSSLTGEYNDVTCEHVITPLAEQTAEIVGAWADAHPDILNVGIIGKLEEAPKP